MAAAELPELARAGPDERRGVAVWLEAGLARIAVFVVPTTVAYLVVGDLVTGALFQTGAFGRLDAVAVWIVLAGYAVGLLATTSSRLLQSVLYALGNTRIPAWVAVLRVLVSLALGAALMVQSDWVAVTPDGIRLLGDLPALAPLPAGVREMAGELNVVRLGAAGLSIAAGLAAWLEYGLLRRAVGRRGTRTTLGGAHLRRLMAAGLFAGLAAGAARPFMAGLHPLLGGAIAVTVTAAAYSTAAAAFGSPEVRSILAAVRRRLLRSQNASHNWVTEPGAWTWS